MHEPTFYRFVKVYEIMHRKVRPINALPCAVILSCSFINYPYLVLEFAPGSIPDLLMTAATDGINILLLPGDFLFGYQPTLS